MKDSHPTAINAFNLNHQVYSVLRPNFAKEVVDPFLVSLGLANYNKEKKSYSFLTGKKILELAAGTGKFTERLVENGWSDNLYIVEPSQGMLESFKVNIPQVSANNIFNSSSYKIPLEDNSVDVAFIAQGFHWFADTESLKEIHRVLKPLGRLGLIWNFDRPSPSQNSDTKNVQYINGESLYFDKIDFNKEQSKEQLFLSYFQNQPWSEEVTKLMYTLDVDVPQYRTGAWRTTLESPDNIYFGKVSAELFHFYEMLFERENVFKYWETRSFITALSKEKKSALEEKVNCLLGKYVTEDSTPFESQGDLRLIKPMVTHAVVVPVTK